MVMTHTQSSLGDWLVREGLITQAQLAQAREEQLASSRSLGRIVVDRGLITEATRLSVLQRQFGFAPARLKDRPPTAEALRLIPHAFAEKHHVVPVALGPDEELIVAMEDPSDILLTDAIKNQIGRPIRPLLASAQEIQGVLERYAEQSTAQEAAREEARQRGRLWRVLRGLAFPVLAFTPIVLFFVALYYNFMDLAETIQGWRDEGNLQMFDLVLYIALIWGSWAVIVYEIDGLILRPKEPDEEDEDEDGGGVKT